MYLCIDILLNRIESILLCLSYILSCYSFHASVPGTGRGCRLPGARLPGTFSARRILWTQRRADGGQLDQEP